MTFANDGEIGTREYYRNMADKMSKRIAELERENKECERQKDRIYWLEQQNERLKKGLREIRDYRSIKNYSAMYYEMVRLARIYLQREGE